jgi:type II secretory pathway pseudopilin PulG
MRRRAGFTIPELLVAMALIIFIMYILAEAFAAGTSAFRSLKAIGDMNERLRTTTTILRRYLSADHFEGKKRLSDANFWLNGPPREGFFRIWHDAKSANYEGADLDRNFSYSSPFYDPTAQVTYSQGLHFAVKLRGNNRGDFFRASVPAQTSGGTPSPLLALPYPDSRFQDGTTTFCSQWAEVAAWVLPTGDVTQDPNAAAPSQPLYTLYLRQRLLVPDNTQVQPPVPAADYQQGGYVETSCYGNPSSGQGTNLYFNSPADVTMPIRRLNANPGAVGDTAGSKAPSTYPRLAQEPAGLFTGNDILLTNVLSFEIRVLVSQANWTAPGTPPNRVWDFVPLADPALQQFTGKNPSFPGDNATGPAVFDTWSSASDDVPYDYSGWATPGQPYSIPLYQNANGQKIQIVAIQITIRIWDANTMQTRQTSLVVDL